MKEVYLLRHGEKDAAGNLTEHGKEVAKHLGGLLPKFTVVVSSNSPRTVETALLLTGVNPSSDDRAGYYDTTQEVSGDISKLAAEQSVTFLEAANLYNGGELIEGIQSQAAQLNYLLDETLASLNDGDRALVVSHDMTITPAMMLRGERAPVVNYLSGYIISEVGLMPFEAQRALT